MKLFAKIATSALVLALVASTGVTSFAASDSTNTIAESLETEISAKRPEMTEEKKAEMIAKAKERLAQQLSDGKITQEQYDETLANIESGDLKGIGRGLRKSDRPEMTEEKKAEMIAKAKERLAQQLSDGKITQEQYDETLANIESGDLKSFGRGKGVHKKAS